MRGRIIGIVIAWVVVIVAVAIGLPRGGWIGSQLHPRPQLAPASDVRMGIVVTAEGIHAERVPDTETAWMDVIFSVRRLDGHDWPDDPILKVLLVVQGKDYAPVFSGLFKPDGRPPLPTDAKIRSAHSVSHDRAAPRRYLCRFRKLPRYWMDASLAVRLVREIPQPDFDLGTYDFASGQTSPPAETLVRGGTLVKIGGAYQGSWTSGRGDVTGLVIMEELPICYVSGPLTTSYPRYGRLIVHDDLGDRLLGVRVYPHLPSRWSRGIGAGYALETAPDARQPKSMKAQFISTDAMMGDSIEFLIPHLTTLTAL